MPHNKMIHFALILWCCVLCIQFQKVVTVQQFFNDDVMIVEGHSIYSSDIKIMLADRNVSTIYVYLTHTFYADEDLTLNGIREFQIFASTWNITQPVTFDLSGTGGARHEARGESEFKVTAGKNGNAGKDGGNFFGLANETINGDYLTVMLNGGNGGDGEDGTASDDVYVLLNVDDSVDDSSWFSNGDPHSHYKKYFDDRGYDSEVTDIDDYTSFYAVFAHNKKASFNIRLHPRKCCGATGIGGAGGSGGRRGKFNFKQVGKAYATQESTPDFLANDGSDGKLGKDGKTCENLALDVRIDAELKKVVLIVLPVHETLSSNFTILKHSNSSKCLPEYVRNNEIIGSPVSSELNETDVEFSVRRYKSFLIENMKNTSVTTMCQKMYEAIDESRELNNQNSLKGLVLEACELEKHYFELKNAINVDAVYQRLSDRINTFNQPIANRQDQDHERALSHLKTILHYKLNDIRMDFSLILNLEQFSELIIEKGDLRNRILSTITNINDVELQNILNQLRSRVNGNYILAEYYHFIEGFKLAYFPFAVEYLEDNNIPASPSTYDDSDVIIASNNLNTINRSIDDIKSNNAEIMMNVNFIDYNSSRYAFFIWKSSPDVRDKIRQLFEGKKVTLLADVKHSKRDYNAMKFNTVDLVFRSSDQSVNDQLTNALRPFDLMLNHTGRSASRCNNKFYEITTDPIPILAAFEKDRAQVPTSRTLIYDKLRENYPMLSPYALWEVQITPRFHNKRRQSKILADLARFVELDIDIELHGTGKFIKEGVSICNNENLAKFYTQMDP